jgi:hypothetical protein
MRDKILDIIANYPKHYPNMIKKNQDLIEWINCNSIITSGSFVAHVRSALYQESNVCGRGNIRKITRLNTGFIGCGTANQCACVAETISLGVSKTKNNNTREEKLKTNTKRAATMLAKYGVAHNLQRAHVKQTLSRPKIAIPTHATLMDKQWLETEYVTKQRSLVDIAAELGVYYTTIGDYCKRHGFEIRQRSQYSMIELEVATFIRKMEFEVVCNDRAILAGKEIDIYIPEKQLGIEINGLYWHSFNPAAGQLEKRSQHLIKSQLASRAGVQLLHFTDHQWSNQQPIVKSIISSKLGITSRVYARQCEIKQISSNMAKEFFNRTHLDGFASATTYIGLEQNGEVVQCMSIGNKRFGDRIGAEVIRFSTKLDHTVVGGLSRLLSYSRKLFKGTIVTFCSRDVSAAGAYQTVGFTLIRETGPGYYWTDGTNIISRQKAQRKNLASWLPSYDTAKSEANNMFSAGYRRYWNSGNYYLELK